MLVPLLAAAMLLAAEVRGQADTTPQVLFTNVRIFDGVNDGLKRGHVLVEGNVIKTVSARSIDARDDAIVIDGAGLTLMPGLIDAHVHLQMNKNFIDVQRSSDAAELAIRSAVVANDLLSDGFTTVRDMGGDVFGLARSIDAGVVPGPRLYPSGTFVSQTSGHGDFGAYARPNPQLALERYDEFEQLGLAMIVDGRPNVLAAVRQNLRKGATQIKLMCGGGGSSPFDPIDTTQYTLDEMRAAVEAAEDWGTYVSAHIFTPRAVNRFLDAGGKCLEHAFFLDEATIERCAREGIYVVPQTWGMSPELFNNPNVPESKHDGIRVMQKQYESFPKWLLEHDVKVAYATDSLGPFSDNTKSRRYELHWRVEYFGSEYEVLKQATSIAGELMAMSGPRNPYPGKLGVIEEGAYADILLVDGNPLEDITVLGGHPVWFAAPEPEPIETLVVIMKDGRLYKNSVTGMRTAALWPAPPAGSDPTPPAAGIYRYATRQARMIRQLEMMVAASEEE